MENKNNLIIVGCTFVPLSYHIGTHPPASRYQKKGVVFDACTEIPSSNKHTLLQLATRKSLGVLMRVLKFRPLITLDR